METEIQNQIRIAINTHDSPIAIRILNLSKKDSTLGIDSQVLYQLRYVRMNSLTPEQLLALMHESILAAYVIPEFDLSERIKDYIELLDNVKDEMNFTHGLLTVLDESEELLGNVNIFLKNVSVKPTLGNWIEDFSSFPSGSKEKDALAEVGYLNKSQNVKGLTEPERAILKNVIKFYDEAVQRIALFDSIKVPQSQTELYKDYDLYALIPGMEDELDEEAERKKHGNQVVQPVVDIQPPQAPPVTTPPIVPQPVAVAPVPVVPPVDLPIAPIPQQERRTLEPLPSQPIITLPKQQPVAKPKPPANPVHLAPPVMRNMDEISRSSPPPINLSKPGVVKDPTNIKLDDEKKRLDVETQRKMQAIQRKLAELKSRNKPNE